MHQAVWTRGRWLVKIRRHLTPRFEFFKAEKPPPASDIIVCMTLVMFSGVLFARLLLGPFGLE